MATPATGHKKEISTIAKKRYMSRLPKRDESVSGDEDRWAGVEEGVESVSNTFTIRRAAVITDERHGGFSQRPLPDAAI